MRTMSTKQTWTTERANAPPDRHSQRRMRKVDEQLFVYDAGIAECGILKRPAWIDEEQGQKVQRGIGLDGKWAA